ncbi:MAG TPA: ribosome maturation factor RimM [Asticcacaulis sp.]|nr:ribosome maturation factor RimM [Asticcacaulis sp.]
MSEHPHLILVAQLGAPHGVQGEIKLLSFTDDPLSVLDYNPLLDDKGLPALNITAAREHKGALLIRAEEIPDRTAADKVKGLKLFIDRADLPAPDEDEYYITDLIGMAVVDGDGKPVGKVANVDNFGAGDLLDIRPLEGANFYIAFTNDHVAEVNLSDRLIVVDLSGV